MDRETTGTLLVLSTIGSQEEGLRIAETLVQESLAACVNLLPGLTSVYWWKGETCHDAEVLLLIKTTMHRYLELEARLQDLHPYETPEILALNVEDGLPDYLEWVGDCVEPPAD